MSALASDAVTIARCTAGHRATKLIRGAQDGDFTIEGYEAGKYLSVEVQPVACLGDLASTLNRVAPDPRSYVLRGELLPSIDPRRCRRLLYTHEDGSLPTFREVPRRWVVIDFDDVPGPYRFDPRDGELAAIYCRTLLPGPWQRCSYWWGLSSSAGFKPWVRIKLAFWLDRPMLGKELERHLKGCPIDVSTLRAVQPIYIARPILVGVADPIRKRTGVEQDRDDQVLLPNLPAEASTEPLPARSPEGRRYTSGSSQNVAQRRLEALCGAVERAGVGGRHRCLIWAAARAVELDDALPREGS